MKRRVHQLTDVAAINSYLHRIGAEPRSIRTAVVKEIRGKYWKDLAIIRFTRDGKVSSSVTYAPTKEEAELIAAEMAEVEFPSLVKLDSLTGPDIPDMITGAPKDHVFEFRDEQNKIVMVQVRLDLSDGDKAYVPWTFWDDNKWRRTEPDGSLPLYGLETLRNHSTVFIHEGAKAAANVRRMVEARDEVQKRKLADHPWGLELSHAAHVGWIGGALNPTRTDWSVFKRLGITRAYIVSDNDFQGKAAVPLISKALDMPTFVVNFTIDWPASFDLGDEFPRKLFQKDMDGKLRYVGPSFRSRLQPATWATRQYQVQASAKGPAKTVTVLRDVFRQMWQWVEEVDLYVCTEMPDIRLPDTLLNKMMGSFSDVALTSRLLDRSYSGRAVKLAYRPDRPTGLISENETTAINLHEPGNIKSQAGDVGPWLEFLEYLFPKPEEREVIERWCATLIGHADARMHFGLLLVTESQGVGKTTLGSAILAPLLGHHNVGWPGEAEIVDNQFNGWLAQKRLVFVNEIYSGHSWKAYNNLKTVVTDKEVTINEKYQRPYSIQNWAHVIACSNSPRPLKIEKDDRRWFYPAMTEKKWPREKFVAFRQWLVTGGLERIKFWAENHGMCFEPGEVAPITARKRELIASSRTEAVTEAHILGEALASLTKPAVLSMKDIVAHVRASVQGRTFDADHELRRAMVEAGCCVWKERVKLNKIMQYAVMNQLAWDACITHDNTNMMREMLIRPSDIFEEQM